MQNQVNKNQHKSYKLQSTYPKNENQKAQNNRKPKHQTTLTKQLSLIAKHPTQLV